MIDLNLNALLFALEIQHCLLQLLSSDGEPVVISDLGDFCIGFCVPVATRMNDRPRSTLDLPKRPVRADEPIWLRLKLRRAQLERDHKTSKS